MSDARDPALPRLGPTVVDDDVHVSVWSPQADGVRIHHDGGVVDLARDGDVHRGVVVGAGAGLRYHLRAEGPWDPPNGLRFDGTLPLVDPYALAITDVDGMPTSVVVTPPVRPGSIRADGSTRPGRPHIAWADCVVYELHVKGFTATHPDIPEHIRGTYAGLAHPAAIAHLVDLGVTSVELLPIHQFMSEPRLEEHGLTNYWGYNSVGFFAPHEQYSSAHGGAQLDEFVSLVDSLHAAGLEVLLDVVYNHTAEGGIDGPVLSMRGLGDGQYYKQRDGNYIDTTGCGNSLDIGNFGALTLVLDSLRYWYAIVGVDGFRFDLAATLMRTRLDCSDRASFLAAVQQDPHLAGAKLIAEPWDVGHGGYQLGALPHGWAEWNDKFRDTVRDFWRGPVTALGPASLAWRITGSQDIFPQRSPHASLNFVTSHDGFTLHDLVTYDHKHNEANAEHNRDGTDDNRSWSHGVEGETEDGGVREARSRTMRAVLASLCLSLGVPMLTMGDEVGRTQRGNNNAYCQDNEISWMNWSLTDDQRKQRAFVRHLLEVRRSHRVFRFERFIDATAAELVWRHADGTPLTDADWQEANTSVLVATFRDTTEAMDFTLVLNASADDVKVRLPEGGEFDRLVDSAGIAMPTDSNAVLTRSVVVFSRRS